MSDNSPSVTIVRTSPPVVIPPDTWGWDCHSCGEFLGGWDSEQEARQSSDRHQRHMHGVAPDEHSKED